MSKPRPRAGRTTLHSDRAFRKTRSMANSLIFSMSTSVDGFISDREGNFGWAEPTAELFEFHNDEVRELGGFLCGRRLYESMVVWETDPAMREDEVGAVFADIWCSIPKVVFSNTLTSVEGNARLAQAPLAAEAAALLEATDKDVAIGGPTLAAEAIKLDLVDEFRMFRYPFIVGGGTSYFPPLIAPLELTLVDSKQFGSRVNFERYRRVR